MSGVRLERVAEEIRREVSEILRQRAHDPRLTWVSVGRVEVSRDLGHATIYVSALGDEATQEASLRVLTHARSFVRTELGKRMRLRKLPEIQFRADLGIQYTARILGILSELGLLEGESGTAPSSDED